MFVYTRVLSKIHTRVWVCHATDGLPKMGPPGPSVANYIAMDGPPGSSTAAIEVPPGPSVVP